MLGGMGASTLHLFKEHDLLLFFLSTKPTMQLALMLRDHSTRASSTPSYFFHRIELLGNLVSHQVDTSPSFYFLDHQTHHVARLDARILLYECILDTL
jgi:hypothetical protein